MQRNNDDDADDNYSFDVEFDAEGRGVPESPAIVREMRRNIVNELNRLGAGSYGRLTDEDREQLITNATNLVIDVLKMAQDYLLVIKFLVRSRIVGNIG